MLCYQVDALLVVDIILYMIKVGLAQILAQHYSCSVLQQALLRKVNLYSKIILLLQIYQQVNTV